jgi:thiosulfate/3-mercaptopyruvate sulfurtransferase
MSYTTFISPADAHALSGALFIDCSYALNDKDWGKTEYSKSHIPGALYADLHHDLASPVVAGVTGRHPLPEKEALVKLFSAWGIDSSVQVIAYDATAGFMAAARLWWLLKWAGHENVAVLQGGKPAWAEKGYELTDAASTATPKQFKANFNDALLASAAEVESYINDGHTCLIDSRTADRYAGQNETIDPIAGHIPSAINRPFNANLGADPAVYREYFKADYEKGNVIFYCGSGVTAAYNILQAVYAGYPFPKLYAGSWSEWIADGKRPVA